MSTTGDLAHRPGRDRHLDATVLICTFDRADLLSATLESLARTVAPDLRWDVLVVDNNSSDDTRAVVERCAARYPVALRYVFEPNPGKSFALNTGIAATTADIIAFTDDDVRVSPEWLTRLVAGLERHRCEYVGGRVTPLWQCEPPRWLPRVNGQLWGVIALVDYGPHPIEFVRRVPLGVNMAVRREAFQRTGGFNTSIGRKAGTLLGQEQREWCVRATAAGLVGYYLPDAVIEHVIPADRLTKRYFRRWFYWRGIARAILYAQSGLDMERPGDSRVNVRDVPHMAGVPRYLYRTALRVAWYALLAKLRNRPVESFERELWLWMFAGIVRQRWTDRRTSPGVEAAVAQPARYSNR